MNDQIVNIQRFLITAAQVVDQFSKAIAPILEPVAQQAGAAVALAKARANLSAAGWLTHPTMPFGIVLACSGNPDLVHKNVAEYYERSWPNVRSSLENGMAEYNIDEESNAAFIEALEAHGHGLYRCVCTVLFPAIERELRAEIFGTKTGRPKEYEKAVRELVDGTTLADFLPWGCFELDHFDHLTKHIDDRAEDGISKGAFGVFRFVHEDEVHRVAEDPIPNRHAAMHGYVSYASLQNSLNALFFADYMFRVISELRDAKSETRTNNA